MLAIFDPIAVFLMAVSGAMVASRKEMDLSGFLFLCFMAGLTGGTVRDLLINTPLFWLESPVPVLICVVVAVMSFFTAHMIPRRYVILMWFDGFGLCVLATTATWLALEQGLAFWAAVTIGFLSSLIAGIFRDIVCQSSPFFLKYEIYSGAALASSLLYAVLAPLNLPGEMAFLIALAAGVILRAGALYARWTMPRYKPRSGRSY
jgi:uncharacterized membrane protein YeiH